MKEIQATEAKAHLAELLSLVERGESIAITRYGIRIAHLIPAKTQDRVVREDMVEKFREKRRNWDAVEIDGDDLLGMRHEGHRL